ncbi:MAG: hypothetical protein ACOCP8_03725, partial [archaeon]
AIFELYKLGVIQNVLIHLSLENNNPDIAFTNIKKYLYKNSIIEGKHIFIDIASNKELGNTFNLFNTKN